MSETIGPNVKRLIIRKMSVDAIPKGGGFGDGIDFLMSGKIGESAKAATAWVKEALRVFKTAPDNPFGDDDEAIAGHILAGIEAREKKQ